MNKLRGVLLIGMTGSGKTPLGEICEQRGIWGRPCYHFDFGESLRRIAETGENNGNTLTDEELSIITNSLKTGALLENKSFHIAQNILRSFANERGLRSGDLLLLNGMPRHIGQAKRIDALVDVGTVVYLSCAPEIVSQRISLNSGGDRNGRADDSIEEIEKKVKLFQERTLPLLEHYRKNGVKVQEYNVLVSTTAEEVHDWLSNSG